MTQELGRFLFPLTPTFEHAVRLQRLENSVAALAAEILAALDKPPPETEE